MMMKNLDIDALLKELTLEEKAFLVAGHDFMYTRAIDRLGIPSILTSDGPHGLRKQVGTADNGIANSLPSTAFPTASAVASSWNVENAKKIGQALAEEAESLGISVILGPGVNVKRNPLGGRNFEYFSEDPLLTGKMAASEIQGIQEGGVAACPKHFAMNETENYRFMGNSVVDERAAREIYLKAFEIAVKEGRPRTIMCAYNQINGTYASENRKLLTDILRKEWGFNGLTMTDWGAIHERLASLEAGLDLEMPGDTAICRKWIIDGVHEGKLRMDTLNQAVRHVLSLVNEYQDIQEGKTDPHFAEHDLLASEIASDSAVLLKNDGLLPLLEGEPYFVTGDLFRKMRYQGAGSSMINPTGLFTPEDAFKEAGVRFKYAQGYREADEEIDQKLIKEALFCAEKYQKVLVFAGLTDYVESEGADRESMSLPKPQLALIGALVKAHKDVIVVLYGGAPIELPFADEVKAILMMYLPGQAGGRSTYDLLFGKKNPSGRLAETWPLSYDDVPFGNTFGKRVNEIYRESVYVGYRYYATAGKKVRYPFGYGLSYSAFEWSDFALEEKGDSLLFRLKVKNLGTLFGADVVELYAKKDSRAIFRPAKELKGFAKVYLAPGASQDVTIEVPLVSLRVYDPWKKAFVLERGNYGFELSRDVSSPVHSLSIGLDGEEITPCPEEVMKAYRKADFASFDDAAFETLLGAKIPSEPPKRPLTLESRFTDLQGRFLGKILFKSVVGVADKQAKKAEKLDDGPEKDNRKKGALFLRRILESNSLRSMSMSAGLSFPYNFAIGFMEIANGHPIKGFNAFATKIEPSGQEEKK